MTQGGNPIYTKLTIKNFKGSNANDYVLDFSHLRASITPKTKLLILNNPHNPIGKVFSINELETIAEIAIEFDLTVIADEVYESLVFSDSPTPMIKFGTIPLFLIHKSNNTFIIIASLPGMFERTITIGSIGKTLGITGWKVGWCIGPSQLIKPILSIHQFIVFSVSTPLQVAVSEALEIAISTDYFEKNLQIYENSRNALVDILKNAGIDVSLPFGGYFVLANASNVLIKDGYAEKARDWIVCEYLTQHVGVTGIPTSNFYSKESADRKSSIVRFAFCKEMSLIEEARKRLLKWKSERE